MMTSCMEIGTRDHDVWELLEPLCCLQCFVGQEGDAAEAAGGDADEAAGGDEDEAAALVRQALSVARKPDELERYRALDRLEIWHGGIDWYTGSSLRLVMAYLRHPELLLDFIRYPYPFDRSSTTPRWICS
jgi:hypothetical protein